MKAYAVSAYDAPLSLHELSDPVARAGEVVVAIEIVVRIRRADPEISR